MFQPFSAIFSEIFDKEEEKPRYCLIMLHTCKIKAKKKVSKFIKTIKYYSEISMQINHNIYNLNANKCLS